MKLYKTDAVNLKDGKNIAKFYKNQMWYGFWDGYITYYFPVNSYYNQNSRTKGCKEAEEHLSFILKNNKLWEI